MDPHGFSGNYLVLGPDASLYELLGVLLRKDGITEHEFIKFPKGREENLGRRWLIFTSLLGQKTILSFAKLFSESGISGRKFENWLNLLSWNHNLCTLWLRARQGKVRKYKETSDKFLSFVGYLDRRVYLDGNIKHGDARYNPMLSAMAAKLAYENEAMVGTTVRQYWKMELLGYYKFRNDFRKERTTKSFMFRDRTPEHDVIVISFRGTEPFNAGSWCTDIDISWYQLPGMGKIHGGFMKALGLIMHRGWPPEIKQDDDHPLAYYTIRERLRKLVQENNRTKIVLTGHSLGGALAILFVAILVLHEEEKLLDNIEGVYTFGQPRVGDEEFKIFMETHLNKHHIKYLRFVYSYDAIPRLPSDDSTFLFKHFGTCLYYNSFYKGKIVEEPPRKNYIPCSGFITGTLNALWELIRSSILPIVKGPDYAETRLLIAVRYLGLFFHGLAAHNPQDYVNITRLGSTHIYSQLDDQQEHLRKKIM